MFISIFIFQEYFWEIYLLYKVVKDAYPCKLIYAFYYQIYKYHQSNP